ncbi:MAG TPA: tyrosine-type recombinase/integrase [Xanthobacteraceae bacterium]|nr:tyrosine-type recombinase/integrase [Xanthobacteraceae bacterium]
MLEAKPRLPDRRPRIRFRARRPISPIGFHRLIQRVGEAAKMPFSIHPHMLRHACGFKLANDGHDTRALQHYLGHKNIQHTVRYTEMAPDRFKDFWRG